MKGGVPADCGADEDACTDAGHHLSGKPWIAPDPTEGATREYAGSRGDTWARRFP